MKAVVFDFFGTLSDPSAESGREELYRATGQVLGVDPAKFWTEMSASFADRITGRLGDTNATLAEVAARCGGSPSPENLAEAVVLQLANAALVQRPHPKAYDVLSWVRARGLRTALVSDCSSELVELWPHHPLAPLLDEAVFSWEQGYRKPDARMFTTAVDRLGLSREDCWYVGDGGGREIYGSAQAGLTPILVTNAHYPGAAAFRDAPDNHLPTHHIPDLSALPDLMSTFGVRS
ncbi:HAD family hydrolase [Kribbella sp. NBC_01245]|uniref:HAD family hydrolase n=1 Tax=Kribbella sp. NBC_01245 TaxID=2903578 RepID=UPI002E2C9029|nr:HAD family hydrolase [Kribbella sp. NBC_01245]